MPYTTSFYADGSCGETGTEVWGLQYLPAGWVTAVYLNDRNVNPYGSNYYLIGNDEYRAIEDGTGINTTVPYGAAFRVPDGTWLAWAENSSPFEVTASYTDNFTGSPVTVGAGYYLQSAYLYDAPTDNYRTENYHSSGMAYADGTFIADQPDSYPEVPTGSGNTFFDGNNNRTEWDGAGNPVFRYSGLYSNGTFITNYGDYNYYWDGAGGFYSEFAGSYPDNGTPTGSTGSGTNQIEINGQWFDNGTWSSTEYHDGNGGQYSDYSYYYQIYGYEFLVTSYYDEEAAMTYYTQYLSDGSAGYYTQNY